MKPRHAAALALVGWYLVIFPDEAQLKKLKYPPQYLIWDTYSDKRVANVTAQKPREILLSLTLGFGTRPHVLRPTIRRSKGSTEVSASSRNHPASSRQIKTLTI
jgi:hypothetical protein